jgi:hypothetical protein
MKILIRCFLLSAAISSAPAHCLANVDEILTSPPDDIAPALAILKAEANRSKTVSPAEEYFGYLLILSSRLEQTGRHAEASEVATEAINSLKPIWNELTTKDKRAYFFRHQSMLQDKFLDDPQSALQSINKALLERPEDPDLKREAKRLDTAVEALLQAKRP